MRQICNKDVTNSTVRPAILVSISVSMTLYYVTVALTGKSRDIILFDFPRKGAGEKIEKIVVNKANCRLYQHLNLICVHETN
jgi:hypothetical protein